ncbi:MAG TPA: peptidyl-prolyl cis-trans isomerase [Acidobacteriota bacterium]|nr:peptidyl-prolyl cis-trans isomerase [Acidobacteriota bacterium]
MSAVLAGVVIVLLAASAGRAGAGNETEDVALVVVNGDTIFAPDLDAVFVDAHARMEDQTRETFDYRRLLDKLVNDRLLLQEARALDLDREEWLIERLEESRSRNAIRQFVADRFKPDLSVTEAEVGEYFQANYWRMQIRTVSVAERPEAEQLIAAVAGGADLDSIVKAVSLDMYRPRGGLHNLKHVADIENVLREQALPLPPGEISAPFPYRQVWAFLRVEQTVPADTGELATYSAKIEAVLKQRKLEVARAEFMAELSSQFPVVVDSAVLATISADSAVLFKSDFLEGSDDPVASVDENHRVIERQARRNVSRAAMSAGDQPFDTILRGALETIKEDLVLSAAADKAGYRDNPVVAAEYANSLDSALIERYLQETVVSRITFSHAEFDAYYQEHLEEFREPPQYQLDRIEVADEAVAQEIVRQLQEKADFDFVARKYGVSVDRAEGERQWISLLSLGTPVRQELEQLQVGQTSRAFRTAEGWMIFRVRDMRQGRVKSMPEVEMSIREVMFQRKFDELLDNTLGILKTNSVIEYNQEAIDAYFGGEL